jgi:formylglycine-generating enzyme required for sulfatase activity
MIVATSSLHQAQTGIVEPKTVRIPEGWFRMGCERGRDDEKPEHRVWVDAFELAMHQVTNEDYSRFLTATNARAPLCWGKEHFCDSQMPVVGVSWFETVSYCAWLSHSTGKRYRLPTEAEWERAARGGAEGLAYPWGDAPPESLPNYASRWKNGPEPVGLYSPNAFGLYNLSDNVHEWCADWYDPEYYARSPERNPPGPVDGVRRSSRGGSWRHHIKVTRTAARSSSPPEFQYADYGFRVAQDLRIKDGE